MSSSFPHRHLTGIYGLQPHEILFLLDEAEQWIALNRTTSKHDDRLSGLTLINAFFENSTRTLLSFEIAGKRLGADVVNMQVAASSVKKGETLIDTAMTLNAMHADMIVIRHQSSGAVQLIADKVDCPVLNAGDGRHEHPTQALLDALTIRRRKGRIGGLTVAICGDILHSRVARSNILALTALGAEVRVIAPPTLMPAAIDRLGVIPFHDFDAGLDGADVVMMLRLQNERMDGAFLPSPREFHALYGLTPERLERAAPDALVMHPGPMNRGVEITSSVADHPTRSAITEQVEMGVAVRMACLDVLTSQAPWHRGLGMTGSLAILNAKLVDPVAGTIAKGGVLIRDRHIAATGSFDLPPDIETIDAKGAHLAPGLVDLGLFAIDMPAFTAGGITRAALMPDQSPPLDHSALVQRAAAAGKPDVWIHPLAAATKGLKGEEMAEIGLMKVAGACAVATGRGWIADSGVMYRLLAYARALDLLVISHAEDGGLTAGAVATEGEYATRMGLAAAPAVAEAMAVARDIMLAEQSGAHLHFRQLSTARAFDLVRDAKRRGLPISCGISPAHLLLSDIAVGGFRTFSRLSPPLRSEDDRQAALAAVADGTIDLICSSHDPLGPEAKRLPFADAEPGMSGAETLLTLSLALVRDEVIDLPRLISLLSTTPARLLGLPGGTLAVGAEADFVLFDPDLPWRIDSDHMASSAGNTPFDGLPVQGKVLRTIKGGVALS